MTADGAWSTHFMTEQTMTDLQTTMTDLHELTDAMQRLILDALLCWGYRPNGVWMD